MTPESTHLASPPWPAEAAPARFATSSFALLLARKDRGLPVSGLRKVFQDALGTAPKLVVETREFLVALAHSPRTQIASDATRGVTVVLHGDIYSDDPSISPGAHTILASILSHGVAQTATALNGAYAAVVVTLDGVDVIIDRVGSRKIFHSEDQDGHWLTTTLVQHPAKKADAAGIASLIINRYQYGGRTLYAGVRTLERASIHRFTPRGRDHVTYWEYDFSQADPVAFAKNMADKRQELNGLIRRAVRRRLPRSGNIWCSLSGGVDSRAIFGALLACRDEWPGKLTALSYGRSTDDDPVVARELSRQAGVAHERVEFSGTLDDAIRDNGRHCEGLVYFYLHALNGIQQVAGNISPNDVLFVGDECFGWHNAARHSFDDVMTKGIGIRAPASVPAYYSYGQTPHTAIQAALQVDLDNLKQRHASSASWEDLEDILYLEERLCNMLLPWREYLNGRYVNVMNPLIDNEILEFMKSVPTAQRRDKGFFRETAAHGYPDLFKVRLAKAGGNDMAVLESLFVQAARPLEAAIAGFDSRLDDVLPPDTIMAGLIDLLDRLALHKVPIGARAMKIAERLRRKYSKVRMFLRGPVRGYRSGWRHGVMSLSPLQMATLLQVRHLLRL